MFTIIVNNLSRKFFVEVECKGKTVVRSGWFGITFEFEGKRYILEGPAQGFERYQISEVVLIKSELREIN